MSTPHRWREQKKKRKLINRSRHWSGPFVVLLTICFIIFGIYHHSTRLLFAEDKVDILTHELVDIATYISIYDIPTSRTILRLDHLIQRYIAGEDILSSETKSIKEIIHEITDKQSYLSVVWFEKYKAFFGFLSSIQPHIDEILLYLGKNEPKNYLVILQNTAESRPNGGFFGSFAFVTISQWRIQTMRIIDSYMPNFYMPDAYIESPSWAKPIYGNAPIGWIAANKFGFTNLDGDIMLRLYDKTFNAPQSRKRIPTEMCQDMCDKQIQGVVWVNTDVMSDLMPWLQQKIRERQFVNASIDIIRWSNKPNKKEQYLREVNTFFHDNQGTLAKRLISEFGRLTDTPSFGVYIPTISPSLQTLLDRYHLITIGNPQTIYLRDTNISHNKVDTFITKRTTLSDHEWRIIVETTKNLLPLPKLDPGQYTLDVRYTLSVPDEYMSFIRQREGHYGISITERELWILWLQPSTLFDNDALPRWWWTRSQIYFPSHRQMLTTSGDGFSLAWFVTPWWSRWLQYQLETAKNHDSKHITMTFEVK